MATVDCTTCTDLPSCVACNQVLYPTGWELFDELHSCLSCTACFTTCAGATIPGWMGGLLCTSAPPTPDACDKIDCGTCSGCAAQVGGSCADAAEACMANSDCVHLQTAIAACPTPPPAPPSDGGASDASTD